MFADAVQTPVVVDAKLTARPEEAVALTVIGPAVNDLFERASNVIVCVP